MKKFIVGRIQDAVGLAIVMLGFLGVYAAARFVVWFWGDWNDAIDSFVTLWGALMILSGFAGLAAALKK